MDDLIAKALEIATKAHKGQKRWNGEPYINHPKRVAKKVPDALKPIALLHDVLEDTNVNLFALLLDLGLPQEWADVAATLTHDKNETYLSYILRVSKCKGATIVKLADLEDNLSDLKDGQRKDKYLLAKYILEEALNA